MYLLLLLYIIVKVITSDNILGSLVAEISALRQHYINNGGRDPAVVSQLTELLKDAEQAEYANRPTYVSQQQPRQSQHNSLPSEELVAIELENYRLQRELLLQKGQGALDHLPLAGNNTVLAEYFV